MAANDGGECGGQVGERIDSVELARFDERCDGGPVLCSGIVARKSRVLPVQCNRSDGPLEGVLWIWIQPSAKKMQRPSQYLAI